MTDEQNDLIQRLRELSRHEHDDLSIGAEAADAIRALIAERDAAFAMSGCECGADEAWRPIGSAPHDGTELLLGWWRTWPEVVWCTDVAPYSNLDVAPQGGGFCHGEATHWQPLPEPPAAIAAQRGGDGDA